MLRARGLSRFIGARTLFQGVDLHLHPEDRIGLVGRNGEGKTTLLRMLAGHEPSDGGDLDLRRGAHVALLRQEIDPQAGRTLIDEVRTAHEPLRQMEAEIQQLTAEDILQDSATRDMWLRSVQPDPSNFLAVKFSMQLHADESAGGDSR